VIEVKEIEFKGRTHCIQITIDSSDDKKAKTDMREIPIDCLNPEIKIKWFKTVDTISKIYKLRKDSHLFNPYQSSLTERIYQILNASGAFYLNNFEFVKRLVSQPTKNEWMEVVVPLIEPLFNFLNRITFACRDATLRTSEDAMEHFGPLEKIIGTMITKWGRSNDKGHGPEVDKMGSCLEAIESSVHRLENIVAPFVQEQKTLKKSNALTLINPTVAKVLNKVNEPPPNNLGLSGGQQIVYIQQYAPEPEVVVDETNMTEIEKQLNRQKKEFSNLDVDDPNAAILASLMDLDSLK